MTEPLMAYIIETAKALCAKPSPQFVPQCPWDLFFDESEHAEQIGSLQTENPLDQCLNGFLALYTTPGIRDRGPALPFVLSPSQSTNGWSSAVSAALQCAVSAEWPSDPAARLTPEHLPRLETEFSDIMAFCPTGMHLRAHIECILDILGVLRIPLDPVHVHTTLVQIAGRALASDLKDAHEAAQKGAFCAKALEYANDIALGEARFEIAAKLDPDQPSQYNRRAAQASIFMGPQVTDSEKHAVKSIVAELPRAIYKQIEDARRNCYSDNGNPPGHEELARLLESVITYRSSPLAASKFSC